MSNSLAAVHPELIVEWSDRNLPLTPDSVTFGSNKKGYGLYRNQMLCERTGTLLGNKQDIEKTMM